MVSRGALDPILQQEDHDLQLDRLGDCEGLLEDTQMIRTHRISRAKLLPCPKDVDGGGRRPAHVAQKLVELLWSCGSGGSRTDHPHRTEELIVLLREVNQCDWDIVGLQNRCLSMIKNSRAASTYAAGGPGCRGWAGRAALLRRGALPLIATL